MRLLSVLHRWIGGLVGLLLAVLGLSGAILVWEGEWIDLPGADDAVRVHPGEMAEAIEVAASLPGGLSRITFASEEIGLHQAIYADGSGAYLNQSGAVVERWTSSGGRPELWLFDLHHHLFAGEAGKLATGVLGLLGIFFVISGAILWWRNRRTFALCLWPARMTRSAIVRQHRDLGVIAAPLLLLSFATGAAMIFPALADAVLAPWSSPSQPEQVPPGEQTPPLEPGWESMLKQAVRRFPDAELRRVQLPSRQGEPIVLRMRQSFEWTPNGRTYLRFDPARAALTEVEDPARSAPSQAIQEKFYPLHAGKVGGWAWKLALTFAGIALGLLGSLAVFSFWLKPKSLSLPGPACSSSAGSQLEEPMSASRKA
jgi:uncharacterized iron-regulated membrane protein